MKGPIGTLVEPPEKGKIHSYVAPSPSLIETEGEEFYNTGRNPSEPPGIEDFELSEEEVAINEGDGEEFEAKIKEETDDPISLAEEDASHELDKLHSEPTSFGTLLAERFQALKTRDTTKATESCPDSKATKDNLNDAIFNDLVKVDVNNEFKEEMHEDLNESNTRKAENEKEEGVLEEIKSKETCNVSGSSKSPQKPILTNIHHKLGTTEESKAKDEMLKENDQGDQNHFVRKINDKKYKCEHCPFASNEKASLKKHSKGVHEKIEHVCKECGYAPSQKGHLKFHIKSVHLKEKIYKCELCPYKSARRFGIKKHVDGKHEKTGSYVCEECGYVASKNSKLKLHRVSVHKTGDKIFKCDQCPYTTTYKASLKIHVDAVHNKMKNHVCEECGYAAARKMGLIKHKQTKHKIGDLQLKCEKCPFTTFSKVAIKNHITDVHEKVKNLVCEECGFAALYSSGLKKHRDSVHAVGDKKFKCDACDYAGYLKCHLKQHLGYCKGQKDKH